MSYSPWPRVSTLNCLTIRARFERRDRGQRLALQELEERPAGGGDVVDLVRDAVLVDRRHGVAAACDREALGPRDCAGQRLRAVRIRLLLEHADRTVPDDRSRLLELGGVGLRGPRADIE